MDKSPSLTILDRPNMPSKDVNYHRSTDQVDEEKCVKPLTMGYRRFTVLERVLIVVVCIVAILTLVFAILYATAKNNSEGIAGKSTADDTTCLTSKCVTVSSDILRSVDWSADPCQDFYQYSCRKFLDSHDIPDTQQEFDRFAELAEKNNEFLRKQLASEQIRDKYSKNDAVSKALTDYYSCMKAEKNGGTEGVEPTRRLIELYGSWNITDPNWNDSNWQLMSQVVRLHSDLTITPLFIVRVNKDLKNSSQNIIRIDQPFNFLLSRDGYLAKQLQPRRQKYKDLMLTVITKLANTTKDDPAVSRQVKRIFDFERQLAKVMMSRYEASNVEKHYKKLSLRELQKYTGDKFNWLDYFKKHLQDVDIDVTPDMVVAVVHLDYLRNMSQILGRTDRVVVGNYLMWQLIFSMNSFLGVETRNYFQEYFAGSQKQDSWQFCLRNTNRVLGLPLSRLFVDEKFDEQQLSDVEEMVTRIRNVLVENIRNIQWMDEETKEVALRKARTIKENVGYPKILIDDAKLNEMYAQLEIKEDEFFENALRKNKFYIKESLKTLTEPVNNNKWYLLPYMINAYYSTNENKIVLPAGILQPPFFDATHSMSMNYGAIGMFIGHELIHGFDNKGRLYDENGKLADWWTNASLVEFKKRTKCLEEKYSQYKFHNFSINGATNLDENIADNGGIKQAFQAYEKWTAVHGAEQQLPGLNITHNQLFFVAFSQSWCKKYRESQIKNSVMSKHAPAMIRIIGTLSNFPEFSKAYNCPLGSKMNARKKCDVW